MKGVVFNLLEQSVREHHGEHVWDELLDATGLDGAYSSLGTYPDEHMYALVNAASHKLAVPANDVIRWFGVKMGGRFATRYPEFYAGHKGARSFLLTLNSIIHPQVRSMMPDADVPSFVFGNDPDGALRMEYHSHRPMCALAEGLVQSSGNHYGQHVKIRQSTCTLRGDAHCTLHIHFTPER